MLKQFPHDLFVESKRIKNISTKLYIVTEHDLGSL